MVLHHLYLAPSGPGDTVSQAVLPLVFDEPTVATLPNYDVDRDSAPGLQILRSPDDVQSSDPADVQRFVFSYDGAVQANGNFKVDLEVAARDFAKADVDVLGALYRCDVASCTEVATAGKEAKNADRFKKLKLDFGDVSMTLAPHETLELRIAVDDDSEADMWLGFGTADIKGTLHSH